MRRRAIRGVVFGLIAALGLAACGIGTVQLVRPLATSDESLTVLLMGDSIMWQAESAIKTELERAGLHATVHFRAVKGESLLADPVRRRVRDAIRETDADIVVMAWTGNDLSSSNVGSDAWHRAWNRELEAAIGDVRSLGAEPYVVSPPPFARRTRTNRVSYDAGIVASMTGAGHISWWRALQAEDCRVWVSDGRGGLAEGRSCFAFDLLYPEDGDVRKVRWNEGAHMQEPWGVWRVARSTASSISREWR